MQRGTLVHVATVPDTLIFFRGQVGYMRDRGFNVVAITSPGEDLDRFAAIEKIQAYGLPMTRRITPLRDLVGLGRLWRWFRQCRPQIVHTHAPKAGLLGMVGAWLAGVPLRIHQMHGLRFVTTTGLKRQLLWWSDKVACALAHHVLSDSKSLRSAILDEKLCPSEKIEVLLAGSVNGVDAGGRFNPAKLGPGVRAEVRTSYGIPADAFVAGFVGRLVRDKGMAELVGAWSMLRGKFPSLHLLVVGPFENEDPVAPEVTAVLRGDPRIHLTGATTVVERFYAAMDTLVLPSHREGLPVVPLEAAAMELPIVATRIPGCVDAVQDGVTGTLVPARDAVGLAEAIRAYLCDPGLRRKHGRAGRERVMSEFRQEAVWEAIYQTYQRLLQTRRAKA